MADYKNCICIACRNKFEPEDDIVVCPDCGTPYHRDCWNEHGKCINTELHETGESWKNPASDVTTTTESTEEICSNCGGKIKKGSAYCIHCGHAVNEEKFTTDSGSWQQAMTEALNGRQNADPNEDMDGITLSEASDFVGKNQNYYLSRFRYFRDTKRKMSPNLMCVIFPQLWFAYRKMWLWTAIVTVGMFLLNVPGTIMSMAQQTDSIIAMYEKMGGGLYQDFLLNLESFVETNYTLLYWIDFVGSYLSLAADILLFLFGNYLYYRHTIKRVKAIKADKRSLVDMQSRIRMAGGAHIGFIFLVLLAEFLLSACLAAILFVIMI